MQQNGEKVLWGEWKERSRARGTTMNTALQQVSCTTGFLICPTGNRVSDASQEAVCRIYQVTPQQGHSGEVLIFGFSFLRTCRIWVSDTELGSGGEGIVYPALLQLKGQAYQKVVVKTLYSPPRHLQRWILLGMLTDLARCEHPSLVSYLPPPFLVYPAKP